MMCMALTGRFAVQSVVHIAKTNVITQSRPRCPICYGPDTADICPVGTALTGPPSQGDDDDELYYQSGPRSMVGHYTNVNSVCRQSWKRQRPTPSRQAPPGPAQTRPEGAGLRNYASHTDSEQEGRLRRTY